VAKSGGFRWRGRLSALAAAALATLGAVAMGAVPVDAAPLGGPVAPTFHSSGVVTPIVGGAVLPFGGAPSDGSPVGASLTSQVVAMAAMPNGSGYWVAAGDGAVYHYGSAGFYGQANALPLRAPIVGMASTPDGRGYWLVASDGGIFTFGDAGFYGSAGASHLNEPIVGMAATPNGRGYWLVASDGGIFTFGDAVFHGSTGALALNKPIVGMAATHDGRGYWLVASDGGIFTFGDAVFHGSTGALALNKPIVGMAATADGGGYWLAALDGGIFTFGDARFEGSAGGQKLPLPVVGIARAASGYWLVEGGGGGPFDAQLVSYLNALPEVVTASVLDLNTGLTYNFNPGPSLVMASTFKVQILGTLLSETQYSGGPTPAEKALAVPMIEISDNADGQALFDLVGGAPAIQAWDNSIGMTDTSAYTNWGLSTSSAPDQIRLLETYVEPNRFLTNASRAYGLYLLNNVDPHQVFGINAGPTPGSVIAAKTGRIPAVGCINDIGWVDGDGRDYLMVVLVQEAPSDAEGLLAMNAVSYDSWASLNP